MELTGGDERAPERSNAAQGGQLGPCTIQARPLGDQDTITPAEAIAEVGGTVSLRAEVPEDLLRAMRQFIESHPNWDQYRLVQAALAGFLVQNGIQSRGVTRCYLANLFPGASGFRPLASVDEPNAANPDVGRTLPTSGLLGRDPSGSQRQRHSIPRRAA